MTVLAIISAAFFTLCLLAAAVGDVARLLIANRLTLGLLAGAPAWHVGAATGALPWAALAAVLVFGVGVAFFAAGWLGGGDVKLAAATAAWLAPDQAVPFLAATALAGGLLAMVLLAWPHGAAMVGRHRTGRQAMVATPMPYGVAIAIGGLTAFAWTGG